MLLPWCFALSPYSCLIDHHIILPILASSMGTLTDITSRAVNKNLRNARSPLHTPKNTPSHSEKNAKTNNFMTPTMASSTRANVTPGWRGHTRTSTPTSLNGEKAVTGKWMSSAAKRVGFRRVGGDGTLRSKKEGSKQSYNAVTFPDKVCSAFRPLSWQDQC